MFAASWRHSFEKFKEMVANETDLKIKTLRSNNRGEFTSNEFWNYFEEHGIKGKFSIARTPQQNGVVERKNKIVEEMARTMLNDSKINDVFWVQVVHIVVHILNRGLLRNKSDQTPYGIWKGRPENVKHFRVFGSKCYIKKEDNKSGKFDSQVDEGIFVGYSWNNKAYICYNLGLKRIVERINLKFDESSLLKTYKEKKNPYMLDDKMNI